MKRKNNGKRNTVKKTPIFKSLMDYTPFIVKTTNYATVFTAVTDYLGRYNHLHPYFGLTGVQAQAVSGLNGKICDSGGSSTVGTHYGFFVDKVKVTLDVVNNETVPIVCGIFFVPFNLVSLIGTNTNQDFGCHYTRKLVLGAAANYNSKGRMVDSVEIAKLNGISKQGYLGDNDWMSTQVGVGSKYSNLQMQFIRLDGSAFAAGVDIYSTMEYYCRPTMKNLVLNK